MALSGYHLGLPAWGLKTWVGGLFPKGTKQKGFLQAYGRVFDTVEGNTTFYALPKKDNVAKWAAAVPDHFRFCFKFPKKISHEKRLREAQEYVGWFLERLEPLGDKLGVLMLQMPPSFSPKYTEVLEAFLKELPDGFRYAVELRHKAFFNGDDEEKRAADVLRALEIDTVIMDARGLHATTDDALKEMRRRKPNLPVVMRATGKHPIVRVVPHTDFEAEPQARRSVAHAAAQVAR